MVMAVIVVARIRVANPHSNFHIAIDLNESINFNKQVC